MSGGGGRILVVDDDRTFRRLLESRLRAHGYEAVTAADGREALERCAASTPDLIVLDILMPGMDGYTFLQEFKRGGGDLLRTPVVVLTTEETMRDIFRIEGVNDYILKPFAMKDLLRKIGKRLAAGGAERRILVVDDEEDMLQVIRRRLSRNGYAVATARDGLEGLEAVKRQRPDLMVLDVMLPRLDGYHVCRMLKFDEKYKDIPVIFLTALFAEAQARRAREVGGDAFLTKPFDGETLLHTIKRLLWD